MAANKPKKLDKIIVESKTKEQLLKQEKSKKEEFFSVPGNKKREFDEKDLDNSNYSNFDTDEKDKDKKNFENDKYQIQEKSKDQIKESEKKNLTAVVNKKSKPFSMEETNSGGFFKTSMAIEKKEEENLNLIDENGESEAEDADLSMEIAKIEESLMKSKIKKDDKDDKEDEE